jgi:hypothetical protein
MTTDLHRLQISLPRRQMRFLAERARRDGVSIAEVIRRMVEREAAAAQSDADSLWEIAGLAEDHGALLADTPVSEGPTCGAAALPPAGVAAAAATKGNSCTAP